MVGGHSPDWTRVADADLLLMGYLEEHSFKDELLDLFEMMKRGKITRLHKETT